MDANEVAARADAVEQAAAGVKRAIARLIRLLANKDEAVSVRAHGASPFQSPPFERSGLFRNPAAPQMRESARETYPQHPSAVETAAQGPEYEGRSPVDR